MKISKLIGKLQTILNSCEDKENASLVWQDNTTDPPTLRSIEPLFRMIVRGKAWDDGGNVARQFEKGVSEVSYTEVMPEADLDFGYWRMSVVGDRVEMSSGMSGTTIVLHPDTGNYDIKDDPVDAAFWIGSTEEEQEE